MTTLLPRAGAIAVLLAVALVSFAQRPTSSSAEGSTDNVQPIDLAKMTLPLTAFGPDYASLVKDVESGFTAEGDRENGERSSYFLGFGTLDEEAITGPALVGSGALLLDQGVDAVTVIANIVAELEDEANESGADFETFPVLGFDGALGFEETLSFPEFSVFFQFTGVIFGSDRLIGLVAFLRYDDVNVRAEVVIAANALRDRMKGVLTGKITDFPAPLPPDVNCNGSLDSIDASLVLQLSAALVDSLPCDALADANQDGRTNAIDASLILQYSAGLIDSLPASG